MLESELQPDSDPEEDLPALAIVGSYRTSRMAHESGLAVLAAGYHYWVYPENGRYINGSAGIRGGDGKRSGNRRAAKSVLAAAIIGLALFDDQQIADGCLDCHSYGRVLRTEDDGFSGRAWSE